MLVKQVDVNTALELAGKGLEIKIMIPGQEWEEYRPSTLRKLLEGCLFFRSEVAVPNPDFEKALSPVTPEHNDPHSAKGAIPDWKMGPQWTVVPNGPR